MANLNNSVNDIYSEGPKFESNGLNSEKMSLASKTKLKYNYIDRDGSRKTIPLDINSTFRFDTTECGSYAGQAGVVLALSTKIYRTIQEALDQYGNQGVSPMMLPAKVREISDYLIANCASTWSQYRMVNPQFSILTLKENKEAPAAPSAPAGAKVAGAAMGNVMAAKAANAQAAKTQVMANAQAAKAQAMANAQAKAQARTQQATASAVTSSVFDKAKAAMGHTPAQSKAAPRFCSHCGSPVTGAFCANCGAKT